MTAQVNQWWTVRWRVSACPAQWELLRLLVPFLAAMALVWALATLSDRPLIGVVLIAIATATFLFKAARRLRIDPGPVSLFGDEIIVTPDEISLQPAGERQAKAMGLRRFVSHLGGVTLFLCSANKAKPKLVSLHVWRNGMSEHDFRRLLVLLHWHVRGGHERA